MKYTPTEGIFSGAKGYYRLASTLGMHVQRIYGGRGSDIDTFPNATLYE